jgi:cytochrome P450
MEAFGENTRLKTASVADTVSILTRVLGPSVLKGAIIRRPRMVALAAQLDADTRAVQFMQRLHRQYGGGPLMLRLMSHRRALLLSPDHVRHVLNGAPTPFSPASFEKRAALSHFEPKNALISSAEDRPPRRAFNERVLQSDNPAHALAPKFLAVVDEETDALLHTARTKHGGILDWSCFFEGWFRVVRRVVFGDTAREDHVLTDLIARLRSRANWAFLPVDRDLRTRFMVRLREHLARAEPGSLASVAHQGPAGVAEAPDHQVPQWLFAFDPAGMTTFRALAVLATHPDAARRARDEFTGGGVSRQELPYLRATILESLRLWPTTPLLLRQSTADTRWGTDVMPAGTAIVIFAPFFHRDNERLSFANWFTPEIWRSPTASEEWPLVPFSGGPAICPGRQLVLLLTSNMLGRLVTTGVRLTDAPPLDPVRPLPGTLDNYTLRFRLPPRGN